MSKSDENAAGAIFLLDDADTVTKKIKRAVTDSGTEITFRRIAARDHESSDDLSPSHRQNARRNASSTFAGKGYGDSKRAAEVVVEFLRPFQERVKQYDDASLDEYPRCRCH